MTIEAPETKLCGACCSKLPKDAFAKKQWQYKQLRRCKSCVESKVDIDTAKANTGTSDASNATKMKSGKKKGKHKKPKPVFAGNQEAMHKPTKGDFNCKLASDICGWCGKAEENEKLHSCSACKNILYCSRACQKADYPEHKLVCEQMKKDRKDSKKERKSVEKRGAFTMSEASGLGSFCLAKEADMTYATYVGELRGDEEPGNHFATDAARDGMKILLGPQNFKIFSRHMRDQTLKAQGTFRRIEFFTDVSELYPVDQFLLSCGPMPDLALAKSTLPMVLCQLRLEGLMPNGFVPDIGDIKVRGYSLNALEWAARRGNYSIAEWLATDPRTKVMRIRNDSAPVAWACYTNKVELAKMLVKLGANSHATTQAVFSNKPATHLASENGQLLALKYLVEECGHDIHELDFSGQDIRASMRINNKMWGSVAGCVACEEYSKSKGVKGEIDRRNTKTKVYYETEEKASEDQLVIALKKLKIAGGREEGTDSDEDVEGNDDNDNPGDYLSELLAVADARYELGQYVKAGGIYYRAYYAALHKSNCVNDPAIFPIAHKLTLAWMKTDDESYIRQAHGMAQQNCMMPGHPPYIRKDLSDVEKVMTRKGIDIQRFGMW
uniref:MYND-type domain-containing protein n=1 Tax=Chaetoceros debilis TaxID=122233 RepID=A0A7S3QCQ4_9STRA